MKVRIFKPAKTTMQSGLARTRQWVLEAELETPRSPEPLMGWTASADTMNQIRLTFSTCEEAVKHAEDNGWEYIMTPVHERLIRPRNYADNFRYIPPKDNAKSD